MKDQRHIISAYVENRSGVLAHVAGMFASRGFNIDSLTVAETDDPRFSRMTIVTRGDDATLEQIRKQLQKVIDVIRVMDFSQTDFVEQLRQAFRAETQDDRVGFSRMAAGEQHPFKCVGHIRNCTPPSRHARAPINDLA